MKTIKTFALSDIHHIEHWLEKYDGKINDAHTIELVIVAGDLQDKLHLVDSDSAIQNLLLMRDLALSGGDIEQYKKLTAAVEHLELTETEKLVQRFICSDLPRIFPNAQIVVLFGNHDCWNIDKSKLPNKVHFVDTIANFFTLKFSNNRELKVYCNRGVTYDFYSKGSGKPVGKFRNGFTSNAAQYDQIAKDVEKFGVPDIVISHSPLQGIYDTPINFPEEHLGSTALRFAADTILEESRYFIFGHVHNGQYNNKQEISPNGIPRRFLNVSIKLDNMPIDAFTTAGYTFDLILPTSKTQLKRFQRRILFWHRMLKRELRHRKENENSVETLALCPICEQGGSMNCGICPDCIQKYLAEVNEQNFEDKQFEKFNYIYELDPDA